MIYVIASIRVKPGKRDAFLEIFKANVQTVLAEKGCIDYMPTIDVDAGLPPQVLDPNVVTIIERAMRERTRGPTIDACLRSLERIRTEPAHVREGYRERLGAWREQLRRECRAHLVDLVELTTDEPVGPALGAYLMKRGRLH